MNPNSFAIRRPYLFSALIVVLVIGVYLIVGTAVFLLKLPNENLSLYMIANFSLSAIFIVILTLMRWWKPTGFQALTNRQHLWMYALSVLPVLTNLVYGVQARGLANILTYLVLAASIGFVEEVAFRGLILRALAPRGMWRAALISAALFGLTHSMNALAGRAGLDVILQIGYALAIGFCWAAVALRTRVIWPLVVLHALIDFASFLANDGFNKAGTGTFDLVVVAVYTIAFAAYGIYLLRANRQPVKTMEVSPARP